MIICVVEGHISLTKDNIVLCDKVERLVTETAMDEMHTAFDMLLHSTDLQYAKIKGDLINKVRLYIYSKHIRKSEILRTNIRVKMYGKYYNAIFTVSIKKCNTNNVDMLN